MRRIIFINRFFYPDHSATSQLLGDLSFWLARRNKDIHIITGRHLYENTGSSLQKYEYINGVHIHRVGGSFFGRGSLIRRIADYLTFYITASLCLIPLVRRGDILIIKTDPPLLSLLLVPLAKRKGARVINWLQDIYPEVAGALGIRFLRGNLGRGLARIRDWSLKNSAGIVVIGKDMQRVLTLRGLPYHKMHVIHNWSDDDTTTVQYPTERNSLRDKWQLHDKFVVGYSGNLGLAHDVETILDTAEILRDYTDICFLFVGGGARLLSVQQDARKRALNNILVKPYQPRQSLPLSLAVPHVHWISLRPELDGFVFPSKFYGIAAVGRPIIVIASSESELSRLVADNDCGIDVRPGESATLAKELLKLKEAPTRCLEMGINARKMLEKHFTKAKAFEKWGVILEHIEKLDD